MAANYSDKYRRNRIALSNANVSAGNYTATNAAAGVAGLANGRSVVRKIKVIAIGDTVENRVRVYVYNGSAYTYQFTIHIPAWTSAMKGEPWAGMTIPVEIELPGTGYTMAYNMEANESDLLIEEIIEDFQ